LSTVELLHYIKRLTGKYQTPFGIAIWGFTAPGEAKEILVDSEGRLQIGGTVTAEVDFADLKGVDNRTLTDLYDQMGTRASEDTLSNFKSQAYDAVNDRYKTSVESTVNPPNLDVALSTRASESTLSSILAQLDITLSALRDALRGTGNKTLTDLDSDLAGIQSRVDDLKSALASIGTDKLLTTPDNPPNLDVSLSTRASETTVSSILSQLDITLSALRDAITAP